MRLNSKRQKRSRRPVDAVGTAPGQALGKKRRALQDGGMLSDDEIDDRCNGAHGEKTAALAGLTGIVVGTGMMMARSVLVDVGLPCRKMVVSETMRRGRAVIKCNSGGGADDAQRIQDNE